MMSTTSAPALLRQQVDRWAETWLAAKFSRLLELRAQDPGPFNYPIAVFSEWRGRVLRDLVHAPAEVVAAERARVATRDTANTPAAA